MTSIKPIAKLLFAVLFIGLSGTVNAQNYVSNNVRIALFSSTPIEDIRAASDKASAVIITKTMEIAVQIPVKSFEFDKKLMQEHFNENYMESDKYPVAKFKGDIKPAVDFTKDGAYPVTVTGILTVHGVDKKRSIPGTITVNNGKVQISAAFQVACVDHGIKIPRLVFAKIAEQISLKVEGTFNQLK